MKKKYCVIIGFVLLLIGIFSYFNLRNESNLTLKEVTYNGNDLLISIDGETSNTLPTSGTYYLVNYDCKNANTKLNWDRDNNKLNVTNGTDRSGVTCYLDFESTPKLSDMPVGSYVAYVGIGGMVGNTAVVCQNNGPESLMTPTAETEAPNSCSGQNAREDIDENGNTYGYCYSDSYKYSTTGWRIAYIDSSGKPVIVSAGSPECNTRSTEGSENEVYIRTANAKALKYCNKNYVDGNCTCIDSNGDGQCDSPSNDAWAINDTVFYNIVKEISGVGKRLTVSSSSLGDVGGTLGTSLYCSDKYSYEECGYNNDLIDNGGFYWFAANDAYGINWTPSARRVAINRSTNTFGLRPVISLSSSVVVIGGTGTMDDPYEIGNNVFWINDGATTVSISDTVTLSLMAVNATQMCISTNTSVCNDYVNFSSSYILDWSEEAVGEKVVYVYYKDSKGRIVATMNRSITLA